MLEINDGKRARKFVVNKDRWILFTMARKLIVNSFSRFLIDYLKMSIKSHWFKSSQHLSVLLIMIKMSQWTREKLDSYRKNKCAFSPAFFSSLSFACFPGLGTGCVVSRAGLRVCDFPSMERVALFSSSFDWSMAFRSVLLQIYLFIYLFISNEHERWRFNAVQTRRLIGHWIWLRFHRYQCSRRMERFKNG